MSLLSTLRVARPGVAAFAAMGMLWGSFAADLPDIKAMLDVTESQLGLLLLFTPFAAITAMLAAARIGAAMGKMALFGASLIMCAVFQLPGQASSVWLFALAMMACGAGTGLTDVLLNARVAAIENQRGLHLMSLCHAAYSFGYAGAAVATGVMRDAGWPPSWVLGAIGLAAALMALLAYERDGTVHGLSRPKTQGERHLGWVPVIGGAMVGIAFLAENAAENWSALFIEQTLGGSPQEGAMGPAAIALTMGVARLFGQALTSRISTTALLIGGAFIAALGAMTAAMAVSPGMAYAGFIVMGAGASVIVPTGFSLVGKLSRPQARARAMARATIIGYVGYFVGPPLVGLIAGQFGLRFAFVFAALALVAIPMLNRIMTRFKS